MQANKLRKLYLDFFKSKKHKIVPSSSMVIKEDPTLMFTNAGMNQFKNIFLGYSKATDLRIANSQKCLRVSGKHNDLEVVGHDTYHHTMFEMLGSWSFGDYFKEDAINWAWEFLIDVCKLEKDRFYVTVFEGSDEDDIEKDHEAFMIWEKVIEKDKILYGNKQDNFWEMGETGPCGPCSEIHYDNRSISERKKIDGSSLVNQDHPQVIEIWNLVFMQYNRVSNGVLEDLPKKHVDTGMGFERLAMIMQGVKSNYDTDLFKPIINSMATKYNITYGVNKEKDIALRVIADHIRAITFAIADGQLPSNTKAGYVIRRILRRAVRYSYNFLDIKVACIYQLVDILVNEYGIQFPEIAVQKDLISRVIKKEEEMFLSTLKQGLQLLDRMIKNANDNVVSGKKVFELYDTFGFPVDLTALILREKQITFDIADFDREMKNQRDRSKQANKINQSDWIILRENSDNIFLGYDILESDVSVSRYREVRNNDIVKYELVFNQTPFYAEGGGQVGDVGKLFCSEKEINITNTKKENKLIIHTADALPDNVKSNFKVLVDKDKRDNISRNHTATHLLHESLRGLLGNHIMQKGSLVNDKYLRFDFSHFNSINQKEIEMIENDINRKILNNIPIIEHNDISIDQAKNMGALMLFGERYEEKVRMIQFDSSKELCGGTHVRSTGEIGFIKILSEGSVSSGTRRIEAVTASEAINFCNRQGDLLSDLKFILKSNNINESVQKLIRRNSDLEKELLLLKKVNNENIKDKLIRSTIRIGKVRLIVKEVDLSSSDMKDISFSLRTENHLAVILVSNHNNKVILTVMFSDDLVEYGFRANKEINKLSEYIGGKGGGQPFFATAGGNNPLGIPLLIEASKKLFK